MIDFLRAIWGEGNGWGEVRVIGPALGVTQKWVTQDEDGFAHASRIAYDLAGAFDVYYGVLPRVRQEGTAEACIEHPHVLWADIDAKDFPSKDDALKGLTRMYAYPQIVVDSGHGYHAYWLLDQRTNWQWARNVMKGIAREVGGDHVYDQPRILRIPGTLNHKDEPASRVRLLRFDQTRTYRPDDFSDYFINGMDVLVRPNHAKSHLALRELPDWLLDLIKTGVPVGARSEATFKVAAWMARYGYTDNEIFQTITSFPDGIGAKYFDKGKDGERWLRLTITTAQERA